jgi:hypothetical protein
MARHGNENSNLAEHHLYEIRDREFNDVYKYGICGDSLLEDGSSPRALRQVKELNRAVRWLRFFHKVIVRGIAGRVKAKKLESEYIDQHKARFGHVPPGNDVFEE